MQFVLDLVHDLPNWLAFTVVACAMCGATVLMPLLRLHVLRRPLPEAVSTGAMDGLKALGTFMVFVLAVSLSQVMGHQRQAEELVQREAALMTQMDRGLARIGVPALAELRPVLADYVRSVIHDEWPAMAQGAAAPRASELLGRIQRTVRLTEIESARQQAIFMDMIRTMEGLSDARYARLHMAKIGLPNLFYAVVMVGFAIMLPVCFMLRGDAGSLVLQSAIVGSLSLLLTMVLVIDRPFSGDTRVEPRQIEMALERNLARIP